MASCFGRSSFQVKENDMSEILAVPVVRTTTLARIREFGPCPNGWAKLLKHLGKTAEDDQPILMSTILESNGWEDAIWCLRAFHGEHRPAMINFVCDCAERVLPIWEVWAEKNAPEHLSDPRKAIETTRRRDDSTESACAARATANAAHAAFDAAAHAGVAHGYAVTAGDSFAVAAAGAARSAACAAAHAATAHAVDDAAAAEDIRDASNAATRAVRAFAASADAAFNAVAVDDAAVAERIEQKKLLVKYFG